MTGLDSWTSVDPGGTIVVQLVGEIDVGSVGEIHDAAATARQEPGTLLVLDASGVTFMDSQGINAIVAAHFALHADGSHLALQAPSEAVRAVLRITGLDRVIPVRA